MVDWRMGVSDPRAFYEGNDYVNRLYDMQAQKAAGAKVASGDLRGAAGDLGGRGDVEGVLRLTNQATTNARTARTEAQSDADRKVAQFKDQHQFIGLAVPKLTAVLQKGGPQALMQFYDQITPTLQQGGFAPETIAQYRQAFQQDPQGTIQGLGAFAQRKLAEAKSGDDTVLYDQATGEEVQRFAATPKPIPGPTQADQLRDANSPFNAQGQPNVQVQNYERDKAGRAAAAIAARQQGGSGDGETWGQPVTEAGTDGMPLVVRYGNRGGRQMVEGAIPSPKTRAPGTKMIGDIGKVGANVDTLARLGETFQDRYGGNVILGDAANAIGRIAGDETGQSQWWQDYQAYINTIRNQLFGSALTPTEKSEFLKAVVTPRMESGEIKKNLARQNALARKAASRQVKPYLAAGYDREVIEGALGMGIDDLDQPDGDGAPSAAPPSTAVEYLRQNPGLAAQFDQKYGQGAAGRAMGQ